MLEPLLAELHRHQTDLAERIRIVEEADQQIEAAIERVRAVLGNGPGGEPQAVRRYPPQGAAHQAQASAAAEGAAAAARRGHWADTELI